MKNFTLVILIGLAMATAWGDTKGTCYFNAKDLSDGIFLDVCASSERHLTKLTMTECVAKAEAFLHEEGSCRILVLNPFTGAMLHDSYPIYRKKVKFSFKGNNGIKLKGTLKK